jgi:hypothetical protein
MTLIVTSQTHSLCEEEILAPHGSPRGAPFHPVMSVGAGLATKAKRRAIARGPRFGVKSRAMSDPKSFWKILFFVSLSYPVWFFLDKLFFKQEERPWVDDALSGLRTAPSCVRAVRCAGRFVCCAAPCEAP